MSEQTPFDPAAILAVLDRHQVRYVVVGGYAARLHGATRPTLDIDVTPQQTRENLTRLAAALRALPARIRVDGVAGGLPFHTDAAALAGMRVLNLTSRHGDLDLTFVPAGGAGYDDLVRRAEQRVVGEVTVQVAALPDIIASKEAAGRPKDAVALPELYELAAERCRPDHKPGRPQSGQGGPARRQHAAGPAWDDEPDHVRGQAERGPGEVVEPSLDWPDELAGPPGPGRDGVER